MPRDPNLDHEAVKLYRDIFKFCPNRGTREDIAVTVTNLELWKDVLENWGYRNKKGKWIKFNPLSVRKMVSEYERRAAAKTKPEDFARDYCQKDYEDQRGHADKDFDEFSKRFLSGAW